MVHCGFTYGWPVLWGILKSKMVRGDNISAELMQALVHANKAEEHPQNNRKGTDMECEKFEL